ncbi:MAG TPA: hypothetical protein PLX35_05805 [Cyclobacteriaceae bacterium]|nr:hypothetical protein [Cyclobacteriaceae bacterium]
MYKITFWKAWPSVYQRILMVLFVLLGLSLVLVAIGFISNPSAVYGWDQFQELKKYPVALHSFSAGGNTFTTEGTNYIVFNTWSTQPLQINLIALEIYFVFFVVGLSILNTLLTLIPRFWFYIGAGVLVVALSTFQLDQIGLFGLHNNTPVIGLVCILLGISIYYQFFQTTASLLQRWVVIMLAFMVSGLIIRFGAPAQALHHIAASTLPAGFIFLLIFMINVAHEIIAGFVSLVGQGTRNSKSLQHFLIISAIYLLTLWMTYLNKIGVTRLGMVIHPLFILGASTILGIWGMRQREPQYDNIIPANPYGVYFIIGLALMATGLMGYLTGASQDIALLSVNDLILYTHIAYGTIFFLYIISNFMGMLRSNLPVYKVMYKPTLMPYFSYRLGALIFTIALVAYNRWMVPVNHFTSAVFTAFGDVYQYHDDGQKAITYYKRANGYGPYNHHASTALGDWEGKFFNTTDQQQYYQQANSYLPTAYTAVNAARTRTNKLEEIFILQDALRKNPGSGILNNNLGVAYSRLGLADSAQRYLLKAGRESTTKESADLNLVALMAVQSVNQAPDSLITILNDQSPAVLANLLAMANQQGRRTNLNVWLPKDSTLNLFTATMMGNYLTNNILQPDTSFLNASIAIARLPRNQGFKEIILAPAAHVCYAHGNIRLAFELLQEATVGGNAGEHQTTLGLWALELGKPDVAITYLHAAVTAHFPNASFPYAIALAEQGKINEAIVALDSLSARRDSVLTQQVEKYKRVLAGPESWFSGFSDEEKYLYLHYRVALADSVEFDRKRMQIAGDDFKINALTDRAMKLLRIDEPALAWSVFKKVSGMRPSGESRLMEVRLLELRLLAARGKINLLTERRKDIQSGPYIRSISDYYEGLEFASRGDTVEAAQRLRTVALQNPYFDEAVATAAGYLHAHHASDQQVYQILAEALQVNAASPAILKAYIPVALSRGYDTYASSALTTLKGLISPASFRRYVLENHLEALPLQ